MAESGEVHYSISCTTRSPRFGEVNGNDYHFLSKETFANKLTAGEFLEHAEVHGNLYGSLKSDVICFLQSGTDVVMDIDVQGAEQIRQCRAPEIKSAVVDLFVLPPSEEILYQRLSGRGTDSAETISLRMANAFEEMRHWKTYQYALISSTKDQDFSQGLALLHAERLRVSRISA